MEFLRKSYSMTASFALEGSRIYLKSFMRGFSIIFDVSSNWKGASKVLEYAARPRREISTRGMRDFFKKATTV